MYARASIGNIEAGKRAQRQSLKSPACPPPAKKSSARALRPTPQVKRDAWLALHHTTKTKLVPITKRQYNFSKREKSSFYTSTVQLQMWRRQRQRERRSWGWGWGGGERERVFCFYFYHIIFTQSFSQNIFTFLLHVHLQEYCHPTSTSTTTTLSQSQCTYTYTDTALLSSSLALTLATCPLKCMLLQYAL